jgi:hypothetical protein
MALDIQPESATSEFYRVCRHITGAIGRILFEGLAGFPRGAGRSIVTGGASGRRGRKALVEFAGVGGIGQLVCAAKRRFCECCS